LPSTIDYRPSTVFDSLIIGGGPAGLSAAVYLGRSLRSVAVFDCPAPGRSDWVQRNYNYLGFPEGITARELSDRGRQQAERFGAVFIEELVTSLIQRADGLFEARSDQTTLCGRTVVLATGVTDRWASFPGSEDFIGRSMHWCIVCDGYEMRGQRVLIIANDSHDAEVALQLCRFTREVTLLVEPGTPPFAESMNRALSEQGIRVHHGRIATATGKERGACSAVLTDAGETIEADHLFSLLGADPNSDLARSLGAGLSPEGYITVDTEARTTIPGLYAAGDVTRLFSHQVVTAAHEGAAAAMAIAYDLYKQEHGSPATRSRG
jgi:thioredoxin reductase (NADPH)